MRSFLFPVLMGLLYLLSGCGGNAGNGNPLKPGACPCPNGPRGDCRPGPCPGPKPPPPPPGPDVAKITGNPAELLYDVITRAGIDAGCDEQDLCEVGLERLACDRKDGTPKKFSCSFRGVGGRDAASSTVEARLAYGVLTREGAIREKCELGTCRVQAFGARCKQDSRERPTFECSLFRTLPAAEATPPVALPAGGPRETPHMHDPNGPRPRGSPP